MKIHVLPLAHIHTITMNVTVATMRRTPVMAPTITGKVKGLLVFPVVGGGDDVVGVEDGVFGGSQLVSRALLLSHIGTLWVGVELFSETMENLMVRKISNN